MVGQVALAGNVTMEGQMPAMGRAKDQAASGAPARRPALVVIGLRQPGLRQPRARGLMGLAPVVSRLRPALRQTGLHWAELAREGLGLMCLQSLLLRRSRLSSVLEVSDVQERLPEV